MDSVIQHTSTAPGQPQDFIQQTNPVAVAYPMNVPLTASCPGYTERYSSSAGRVTGCVQLICGIGSVIIGVVQIILNTATRFVAQGIWGGVLFYIPTGILGIVSHRKSNRVILAYMVMSILSSVCGGTTVIFGALSAVIDSSYQCYDYTCNIWNAGIAVDSILAITGLVEMIVAIVASAYCCGGICALTLSAAQNTVAQNTYGVPVVVTAVPPRQTRAYAQLIV